jgi:predicted nuclease of predicted toxin-antitoxin system
MRAKLDENLPAEAVAMLTAAGWECSTVHQEGLAGAEDGQVVNACQAEQRVLFTLDLDFADIRAYPPDAQTGIVVLRPAAPDKGSVLRLLGAAVQGLISGWAPHRLWIVEPHRVRVREGEDGPIVGPIP